MIVFRLRVFLVSVVLAALPMSGAYANDDGDQARVPTDEVQAVSELTRSEQVLAEAFAPVIMLVKQDEACDPGEPFKPSDADLMFDNRSVALRGPWRPQRDLVAVAPSAVDVSKGLPGYLLDMPGNPLNAGCDYEQWADRVWANSPATIYAHVATQSDVPNRLALQFYFFFPYNDYNNKHEADWERIQLEFAAPDAATALAAELVPTRAVYSKHYGSEYANWDDDKLEKVDEVHPVVYISAGSHASQFSSGVFMGNNAEAGFGCDTTAGDLEAVDPVVKVISSDPKEAKAEFPWINYRGHWGEVGPKRFYEGPTGPNMKSAWKQPFTWSDGAASTSVVLPGGDKANTATTKFYCNAIGQGSDLLRRYINDPGTVLLVLGAVIAMVLWLLRRTEWQTRTAPLLKHRTSGQIVYAAWQAVTGSWRPFLRVASPTVTLSLLAAVLQSQSLTHAIPRWITSGANALALLGLLLSAGAITLTMRRLDQGQPVRFLSIYAESTRLLVKGSPAVLVAVLSILLLAGSLVLAPLAVVLLGAWSLLVSVIVLEGVSGFRPLRRSLSLVRHSL